MFTEIQKLNGKIRIHLTDEGKEELYDMMQEGKKSPLEIMQTLFSDNGEGFVIVSPEDVGALTDSFIITDEYDIEDDGSSIIGDVYWLPDYAVRDELKELFLYGYVDYVKGDE